MRWAGSERHLRTHPWVCRATARPSARLVALAALLTLGPALGACAPTPAPVPTQQTVEPSTRPSEAPSAQPAAPTSTPGSPSAAATTIATATPTTTAPAAPLVASASWVTRSGVRAAKVVPTEAGRATTVDADAVWAQLVARMPAVDSPGMRDQLVCHVHFARGKTAWFLEPARPAVGYAATVAAGCNPGAVRDAG